MAKGRKKGKQSWGHYSKADRHGTWKQTLHQANWELKKQAAASYAAASSSTKVVVGGGMNDFKSKTVHRINTLSAARVLAMYINGERGPQQAAARARFGLESQHPDNDDEQEKDDICRETWLANTTPCASSSSSSPSSLIMLCEQFIGQNLPLYGAAKNCGEAETAEAIKELFELIPCPSLERIALAASLEDLVDDTTLDLLCQPNVRNLVLCGSYTDAGLARAIYPRLAEDKVISWEDDDCLEPPSLIGCAALQRLLLCSPLLTPKCLKGLGKHLSTLRSLALPRCFNTSSVTITPREILLMASAMSFLEEINFTGCTWLREKALAGWILEVKTMMLEMKIIYCNWSFVTSDVVIEACQKVGVKVATSRESVVAGEEDEEEAVEEESGAI